MEKFETYSVNSDEIIAKLDVHKTVYFFKGTYHAFTSGKWLQEISQKEAYELMSSGFGLWLVGYDFIFAPDDCPVMLSQTIVIDRSTQIESFLQNIFNHKFRERILKNATIN